MIETVEKWGGVLYDVRHNCDPLDEIFDRLNARYWNGKLPRYAIHFSDDDHPLAENVIAETFHDRRVIVINHVFAVVRLRGGLEEALTHEMAHIATRAEYEETDDPHGPRFRRELARVSA